MVDFEELAMTKDAIEYYVESCDEPDFYFDEEVYDIYNLDAPDPAPNDVAKSDSKEEEEEEEEEEAPPEKQKKELLYSISIDLYHCQITEPRRSLLFSETFSRELFLPEVACPFRSFREKL